MKCGTTNTKEFLKHSGDFKIDELSLGFYVLLTSPSKKFVYKDEAVSVTPFWVSNMSYLTRRDTKQGVEFFVMNRETGFPLKGVKAK